MKSDHRSAVQALDLAHFEEHSPGVVFWHSAGVRVLRRLEDYCRHLVEAEGYQEVRSPQLLNRLLWEQSGHWEKYQENMYVDRDGELALKPMSCPGHLAIFQNMRRSYRELPWRAFEFGKVHRREPSGALSGLFRLREFVQDDAHVLVAPNEIGDAIAAFVRMVERAYPAFGFEAWSYRLALRPQMRAGSDDLWDKAEGALRHAVEKLGLPFQEEPGGGAFYGPKLEVVLSDRLGRSWQCGVIQVDFVLPERFQLSFQNAQGVPEQPVLLHHAVLGSLERFLGIILEQEAQGLPLWLHPAPVAVCPVSEAQELEGRDLIQRLRREGIPAQLCLDGPLSGRLRHLAQQKVPFWAVLGKREVSEKRISVREAGSSGLENLDQDAWIQHLAAQRRFP